MTLATRCTACGTSFRVVQDQLKVSGGWVRCGRCNEIFNALEGLYEVGSPMAEAERRGATVPALARADETTATPRVEAGATLAPPAPPEPEPEIVHRPEPAIGSGPATDAAGERPAEPARAPPPEPAAEPAGEAAHEPAMLPAREIVWQDDAIETVVPDLPPPSTQMPAEEVLLEPSPADDWQPEDSPAREPMPSFLRAAEPAPRRRFAWSRRALGAAALLLLAALAGQATLAYRDVVAARWPALRAPLQLACGWVGCRIEPLRFIAALSVESSSLQQVGSEPVYALQVTLRNRSDTELMAPAIDLVLSDSQGRIIARRVLSLAELARPEQSLPPGSEIAGQVTIATGPQRVAGYTIEIFYP